MEKDTLIPRFVWKLIRSANCGDGGDGGGDGGGDSSDAGAGGEADVGAEASGAGATPGDTTSADTGGAPDAGPAAASSESGVPGSTGGESGGVGLGGEGSPGEAAPVADSSAGVGAGGGASGIPGSTGGDTGSLTGTAPSGSSVGPASGIPGSTGGGGAGVGLGGAPGAGGPTPFNAGDWPGVPVGTPTIYDPATGLTDPSLSPGPPSAWPSESGVAGSRGGSLGGGPLGIGGGTSLDSGGGGGPIGLPPGTPTELAVPPGPGDTGPYTGLNPTNFPGGVNFDQPGPPTLGPTTPGSSLAQGGGFGFGGGDVSSLEGAPVTFGEFGEGGGVRIPPAIAAAGGLGAASTPQASLGYLSTVGLANPTPRDVNDFMATSQGLLQQVQAQYAAQGITLDPSNPQFQVILNQISQQAAALVAQRRVAA